MRKAIHRTSVLTLWIVLAAHTADWGKFACGTWVTKDGTFQSCSRVTYLYVVGEPGHEFNAAE